MSWGVVSVHVCVPEFNQGWLLEHGGGLFTAIIFE